jgi:hypothetical protein
MKANVLLEPFQFILHYIKVILGLSSNYHMRHHKHQKLSSKLNKFMTMDHRSIEKPDFSEVESKNYFLYPPNPTQ